MAARSESTNGNKTLTIGAPKLMRSWSCKLSAVKKKIVRLSLAYHGEFENAMQRLNTGSGTELVLILPSQSLASCRLVS
jgi:hypothetical protein